MSNAYKFLNPDGMYFVTSTVVGWIDVFTRAEYRKILLDSFKYCQGKKGLEIFAWVLMTNHFHWVARAKQGYELQDILRDMKKYTSRNILKAIAENVQESRRDWMLYLFKRYGTYNSNNKQYQFWQQDNRPIELWHPEVVQQKIEYIHQNPVRSGLVDDAINYPYSSARSYSGKHGLLEVMLI